MTDQHDDVDQLDPRADGETAPEAPTRRRSVWPAIGAFAALAAVTGVVLHGQARDARTPEAAALAYAQLVADGEIEAATAMVPIGEDRPAPPGSVTLSEVNLSGVVVDPALLTDSVYSSAAGLTDVSVDPVESDGAEVAMGDVAEVVVHYSVREIPASTVVRVERDPDDFPALPTWRVVDSLAVPVLLPSGPGQLGTVLVEGVVTHRGQPVGDTLGPAPTMLYPGDYELTRPAHPYLESTPQIVRVAAPRGPVGANDTPPILAPVNHHVAPAAYPAIQDELDALLSRCQADPLGPDRSLCPAPLVEAAAAGLEATMTQAPTVLSVGISSWAGSTEPRILLAVQTSTGTVETTSQDGSGRRESFSLFLPLEISEDGTTLTPQPALVAGSR